jgi:four helix bundle protein
MRKSELEERLISFAVLCIEISKDLQENKAGIHLAGQIIRSSSSSALNYGEAQSGESRKDFIHKMKIVLKELRESHVCLRIISRAILTDQQEKVENAISEANELISIFVKSVSTAENRERSHFRE